MRITIILNEPYPYGMACTSRVHLYAKGLGNAGASVNIIIPKPKITDDSLDVPSKGEYDTVLYEYATKNAYRQRSFLKRRFDDFRGPVLTALLCLKNKPDVILLVGGGLLKILLYKISSLVTGSLYYREKSEIPYMHKDRINEWDRFFIKRIYSVFDGLIVITRQLGDFFTNELKLSLKTITIPILIETEGIVTAVAKEHRRNYLLYTGSLLDRKDGILTMLHAFSKIVEIYPGLKLWITGNAKQSTDYNKVIRAIKLLNLEDSIYFTGFLTQTELIKITKEARLCLLIKPPNRQNQYNFPTKVGEYLITGSPVLATKSDTLETIFNDGKDIFFTPFSTDGIVASLKRVLNHPDLAQEVGLAGREKAKELFSNNVQMNKLKDFFTDERN